MARSRLNRNEPSSRFIIPNLLDDFFRVSAHISPMRSHGPRREGMGTSAEEFPRKHRLSGFFQYPHLDPSTHNAGLASANIKTRVHAWKIGVKLLRHPFEKLSLFPRVVVSRQPAPTAPQAAPADAAPAPATEAAAAPWLQSGGCARASHRTPARSPPACARARSRCRSAAG